MNLSGVRIVLVGTTHPGNIGATARAMANMGLGDLRLVEPRVFPSPEATARAAGADAVLENARVYKELHEAVADCTYVVGATARRRSIGWPLLAPQAAAAALFEMQARGPVALVFGREASGLANQELDHCQAHVRIPVCADFSSLNLATAVAILVYELHKTARPEQALAPAAAGNGAEEPPLATVAEIDRFMVHLGEVLEKTGFLGSARTRLLRKLRRLFTRTPLQQEEVNILRGILTSVEQYGAKRKGNFEE